TVRLEGGGVARAVLDLCTLMAARGHPVTLVTADPTDVPADWPRVALAAAALAAAVPASGAPAADVGPHGAGRVPTVAVVDRLGPAGRLSGTDVERVGRLLGR